MVGAAGGGRLSLPTVCSAAAVRQRTGRRSAARPGVVRRPAPRLAGPWRAPVVERCSVVARRAGAGLPSSAPKPRNSVHPRAHRHFPCQADRSVLRRAAGGARNGPWAAGFAESGLPGRMHLRSRLVADLVTRAVRTGRAACGYSSYLPFILERAHRTELFLLEHDAMPHQDDAGLLLLIWPARHCNVSATAPRC